MGVLSCHRNGCENIMCDIYIPAVGYVCDDCKEEFKNYTLANGYENLKEYEILKELKNFMRETVKDEYSGNREMSIDEFFNEYFK